MPYKIQKLGLGGILDQAITLVKNHFGLLFQIMLMTLIPWSLIAGFIQLAIIPTPPTGSSPEEMARYGQAVARNLPLIFGLAVIGGLIILPIANAAVIYSVAEIYLGKAVTAGAAIQKGLSKVGALIGTAILMGLAIMGGMILFIIPGILCALWFGLAQHVVVLESLSGTKALGRSRQLVRPFMGTFLALGFLVFIISAMVSAGAVLIPQAHAQLVVTVLINAILTMFSTAVFVVFYFSCRCGVDNFDLEHLAAAVGESGSAERLE